MAGLYKRTRRAMRRAAAALGRAVLFVTPRPVREAAAPYARYADMLFRDYAVIRLVFKNRHRLDNDAWRSAQPLPHQVRAMPRLGIKTIVNLRNDIGTSTYRLERAAALEAGLAFIDFELNSRDAPLKETVLAAKALFEQIEYPVLMHCKSGADRAGLMSVLYAHFKLGQPIDIARRQLALRYGHFRQADTGVLDHFFECYLADAAKTPISFSEWVETRYDREAVRRSFKAEGWANRLVNSILQRE